MHRKHIVIAAALTAATALPAAAGAADLAGAPALRVIDTEHARVQITVDDRLPRRSGDIDARITVAGNEVRRLRAAGRHGYDFKYAGVVSRDGLEVGRKYTMRISLPGERPITRQVKLHPRRG